MKPYFRYVGVCRAFFGYAAVLAFPGTGRPNRPVGMPWLRPGGWCVGILAATTIR
jgi:hypothetical protein